MCVCVHCVCVCVSSVCMWYVHMLCVYVWVMYACGMCMCLTFSIALHFIPSLSLQLTRPTHPLGFFSLCHYWVAGVCHHI